MRKSALILISLLVLSCSDNDQDIQTTKQECPKQECPSCEKDCVNDTDNGWCGDGICDSDESCNSCEKDCGQCKECPALECDGKECPSCPSCEVCQKCETCPTLECPSLECDGKECPSCPSCEVCQKCETCPTLECDGKECPSCPSCQECDKSELESQIKDLNSDLSKTKEALETQIKATESCTGDLDSCTKDLAQKSLRNNKSGDRLKLYAYIGEDGTQVINTYRLYDTKNKKDCTITDYTDYGCDNMRYCANAKNSTLNPNGEWNKYVYCNSTYDSKENESTIVSLFGEITSISVSIPKTDSGEYEYYTDSECTNGLSSPYINDTSCILNADTIAMANTYETTNVETRICMDSSTYEYTSSKAVLKYYKPIANSGFTTLYRKSSKNCSEYDYYKNIVLLRELNNNEVTEIINKAKQKRKEYCQNYCKEIDRIAKDFDWVKFEHKLLEE